MSFFTSIKEKIAKYKLKKLQNPQRNKAYVDWNKINRILLLYSMNNISEAEANRKYSELYEILDKSFEEKSNVKLLVCVNKCQLEQKRFNIFVFDAKNCNFITGMPPKEIFDIEEEQDSDIIINLSPTICYPLEYIAEKSDAKLKVSVVKGHKGAEYDMYFTSESESVYEVFNSIKYYLQKIKAE